MLKLMLASALLFCATLTFAATVEVNEADADELMQITGIGPALSDRILQARADARFDDWRDLIARVRGIGHKKARRFSDAGLIVNGASYRGVAITLEVQEESRRRAAMQKPAGAAAAPARRGP